MKKSKIAVILIVALIMAEVTYAGQLLTDIFGVKRYLDDDGTFAVGWRWLDLNDDGICECYRFNLDGVMVFTPSVVHGKRVNSNGQWVKDGIVQQIFKNTGRPLYETNVDLDAVDTNNYIDFGTDSEPRKRRINTTKLDMKARIKAAETEDDEEYLKTLVGPNGKFEKPDEGYVVGKGVKSIKDSRPIATRSSWGILDDATKEDEIRVLAATESIVAGREMRRFVSASNKYTSAANGVKIFGGGVWNDVMVLQGNGAYAKFTLEDPRNKRFKANYMVVEVAHQTHGESTADTYCGVELYINGKSIDIYDDFCDGDPEKLEIWFEDTDNTVELRAVVTGDAPGRKIYLRNGRFRQIKEKDDD